MKDKYKETIYNLTHLSKAKMEHDGVFIDRKRLEQDISVLWDLYNKYQELVDQNKDYTLEECKKMWEELGYKWFDRKKENYVELRNEEKEEIIIIDYEKKRYAKSDTRVKWVIYITYQEHYLITKTFKALEKEKK